jgi:putative oxidoreductase
VIDLIPVSNFSFLERYESDLKSLMRVMVGFTFSLHGWQKFFGMFGGIGGSRPELTSMLGAAGVLETFGGLLIILGLFTRPVAFLLAGEMAVGYFRAHAPRGWAPIVNGGELAVFYCFFFLWLSSSGAGRWSLDRVFGRKY